MVNQIYPPELQLNKANTSDKEALFGFTSVYFNGFISSKIYDKRDDFDFGKSCHLHAANGYFMLTLFSLLEGNIRKVSK